MATLQPSQQRRSARRYGNSSYSTVLLILGVATALLAVTLLPTSTAEYIMPHQRLGVPPDAPPAVLRKAYRRKVPSSTEDSSLSWNWESI
eukprot:3738136-Rhodomonas_salina.3